MSKQSPETSENSLQIVHDQAEWQSSESCNRTRSHGIKQGDPCVAKDLIFNILLDLPANSVYNTMRRVCRSWHEIIRDPIFISTHWMKSNGGLIVQRCDQADDVYYAEIRNGKIEINRLEFGSMKVFALASCHGLVVLLNMKEFILHVVNPVTKQHIALPDCLDRSVPISCSIGYAVSSRVYKVVCIRYDQKERVYVCGIISVGVDAEWRSIDLGYLSLDSIESFLKCYNPISTDANLFWVLHSRCVILMLNWETETLQELPYPSTICGTRLDFMAMGGSLCCFTLCALYVWEFWELREPASEAWTRLPKVDVPLKIDAPKPSDLREPRYHVFPIAWL